jgi:hypothetical protein
LTADVWFGSFSTEPADLACQLIVGFSPKATELLRSRAMT